MTPAQQLAAKIRELLDDLNNWPEFKSVYVFDDTETVTKDSNVGVDKGWANFVVMFDGKEYGITINPEDDSE